MSSSKIRLKIFFLSLFFLVQIKTNAQTPSWQWANAMGGTGNDLVKSITLDASGNIYITGSFSGTADFDPGPGIYTLTSNGYQDIYFAKYDANGNFIWAKSIGGADIDYSYAIVLDRAANVYLTGYFHGTIDFDPDTAGIFILSSGTGNNIFISKSDSAGNFIWAKSIGSNTDCSGRSIALDDSANVYTLGLFTDTADFDAGSGVFNLISDSGSKDIFILKSDSSGNFIWAKRIGGPDDEHTGSIAIDASGMIYYSGGFNGTVDFDPGSGSATLTSTGGEDIFVSKLNRSGKLSWAKHMGGTDDDYANSLAVDSIGYVYVTGSFKGIADFLPGAGIYNLTSAGDKDIFVLKLDTASNFIWAKKTGGPSSDEANFIMLDNSDNVYTTGFFSGVVDFNPGGATFNINSAGAWDFFLSELDSSGNFLLAKRSGGPDNEIGYGIATDNSGNLYAAGTFISKSIKFNPFTIINTDTSSNNSSDIFIAKLSSISASTIYVASCNSYTSPSNLYVWTTSGTYIDTIPNSSGGDSIITIHLTIGTSSSSSTLSITACNSYTSPSGLYTWTSPGTYMDTIPNAGGCDSTMTINLTILNGSSSSLSDTACNSYLSPSGHYVWTTSGIYVDTLVNAVGCDSIIVVNLFIKSTSSSSTITTCSAYTSPSGIYIWTTTGIYHDTIQNSIGCDSLITVNLIFINPTSTQTDTSCFQYVSPSGNYTWTTSGVFNDTLPGATGCDSVIIFHITINTVFTPIFLSGNTLYSSAFAATFQWLDCDNGFAPIAGQTNNTFTPTVTGNYAVSITQNGCTDTSACHTVTIAGISEINPGNSFEIFPNPANFNCTVDLGNIIKSPDLYITDVAGKIVYSAHSIHSKRILIDLKNFAEGIYIVQVHTSDLIKTKKLVVVK